jgi:hypothetical protein
VLHTEAAAQHKLLVHHIEMLRTIPALKHCQVVMGLESNLGFEAQHTIHALRKSSVRNWIALMEGVDGTPGLLTTNSSKEVGLNSSSPETRPDQGVSLLTSVLFVGHVCRTSTALSIEPPPCLGEVSEHLGIAA